MGFSVAGSSGVIFLALLVCFSTVFIQLDQSIQDIKEEVDISAGKLVDEGLTKYHINTILYNRSSNQVVLELKNVGSTVLNTTKLDILINGDMVPDENISIVKREGDGNFWPPGSTIKIYLEYTDFKYDEALNNRVEEKIDTNSPFVECLSTNSYYTYVVDGGDVLIYDHNNNFLRTVSGGEINQATDASSTYSHIYVIDGNDHIDRFDYKGVNGAQLIANGGELVSPKSISVTDENDNGRIYVLDENSHIDRFDLDGNYLDTPISGLIGATDIYVTDHIYIVNKSAGKIERFDLDGNNQTDIIDHPELASPSNITVSDADLNKSYIYVIDSTNHIDTFSISGVFIGSIESEMGNNLSGIDVAGDLQIGNGLNGWFRISTGVQVKIVDENGIPDYETI